MKKLIFALMLCATTLMVGAAELPWKTSLPDALKTAKAGNKLVMMDFTGSDWCVWCLRLKKEVFDTQEFAAYALKNLILVEVDFPAKKVQSAALKKANQELSEKYKIEGYPTIIVLSSDGKQIGTLGYMKGGPKPFIAALEKLRR